MLSLIEMTLSQSTRSEVIPYEVNLYSLGVFSKGHVKTHISTILNHKAIQSTEYFSYLFGQTRSLLFNIISQDEKAHKLWPLIDNVEDHCDKLQSLAPAYWIVEAGDMPCFSEGVVDNLGVILLQEKRIVTAYRQHLEWSELGVVASRWAPVEWMDCRDFFNSNAAMQIDTEFDGPLNETQYGKRWKKLNQLYDFGTEQRMMMLIYILYMTAAVLLTGTFTILKKCLKKDIDIMSSTVLQDEFHLKKSVAWKRIQMDVFRPPPYPTLFITIISNGMFVLVAAITTLLMHPFLPWLKRTFTKDLLAILLWIFMASFSQGICVKTLENVLYKSRRDQQDIDRSHMLQFFRVSILRIPIILIMMILSSIFYANLHLMTMHEDAYTYSIRVVIPTVALIAISNLALISGTFFPILLTKPNYSKHLNKAQFLEDLGGTIIPQASVQIRRQEFCIGILIPLLIAVPPFWLHFGLMFGQMWIGIGHIKLMGLIVSTFFISWLTISASNIATCYLRLQRGDYNWWWPTVKYNVFTAFIIVFVLYMAMPTTTFKFMMPILTTCTVSALLLLSTLGFVSQYAFIRYIYLSLKIV